MRLTPPTGSMLNLCRKWKPTWSDILPELRGDWSTRTTKTHLKNLLDPLRTQPADILLNCQLLLGLPFRPWLSQNISTSSVNEMSFGFEGSTSAVPRLLRPFSIHPPSCAQSGPGSAPSSWSGALVAPPPTHSLTSHLMSHVPFHFVLFAWKVRSFFLHL